MPQQLNPFTQIKNRLIKIANKLDSVQSDSNISSVKKTIDQVKLQLMEEISKLP